MKTLATYFQNARERPLVYGEAQNFRVVMAREKCSEAEARRIAREELFSRTVIFGLGTTGMFIGNLIRKKYPNADILFVSRSSADSPKVKFACENAQARFASTAELGERQSAALIEPFPIGWHALSRCEIKSGDKVLVIGAGPIGLFATIFAKRKGAVVHIADLLDGRLEKAKHFGAAGIRPGTDRSFIGFDNKDIAGVLNPKLTVVLQPVADIGRVAAETLVRIIEGERGGQIIHLPTELFPGGSVIRCKQNQLNGDMKNA